MAQLERLDESIAKKRHIGRRYNELLSAVPGLRLPLERTAYAENIYWVYAVVLQDDVPFREQIELDSMDFLDIVMELRKQYRIQIPEEDYPHLNTMGGAVNYLTPLMKDVSAPA